MGLLNKAVETKQMLFELQSGATTWTMNEFKEVAEKQDKAIINGIETEVTKKEHVKLIGTLADGTKFTHFLFESNMDYIIPHMVSQMNITTESDNLNEVLLNCLGHTFNLYTYQERGKDGVTRNNTYFYEKLKGGLC